MDKSKTACYSSGKGAIIWNSVKKGVLFMMLLTHSRAQMRRLLALLLALAFVLTLPGTGAGADGVPTVGEELLKNGDFSQPLLFQLYKESGGNAAIRIADGELEIDVTSVGQVPHAIQPYYDGFGLVQGVEYILSYDVRATMPRELYVRIQLNGGDYHAYFEQLISVTEETQHFSTAFVMEEGSDPAPRLCVNMGYVDAMRDAGLAPENVDAHRVYFDNFSLKVKDAGGAAVPGDEENLSGIRLNQLGYLPDAGKTAVFAGLSADEDRFAVADAGTGETVFTGVLSAPVDNPWAGETDRVADFSDLTEPGSYQVLAADGTASPVFRIGEDVYGELLRSSLRMLYLQRCGTELPEELAGAFSHPVCHTQQAVIYGTEETIDVSGGWHDAGDYGRYVVSGAKAAADLLLSYERSGALLDDVGIPESGDGVDDRLQEVRWELDWLQKMQAPSGGVYHKVSGRTFPGIVAPHEERTELVVCPVSSTATGDFAAVMALAARIFRECGAAELEQAADGYLQSAVQAWNYLASQENKGSFVNPEDVLTGEYPDEKDADERFWAAAELARTTGSETYRAAAEELLHDGKVTAELGWVEMGGYGLYALLTDPAAPEEDALCTLAKEILADEADSAMQTIEGNPYGINRTASYEWGSNMGVANTGVMLLMAQDVLGGAAYGAAALRQLDYLLGENATGYCFVSGMGSKSPEHPHHRPSQLTGEAMPGMLAGGPNNGLEDPFAANVLRDKAPAMCYADSDQSYSTNEVTVYWNSPLIALLSAGT